MKRRRNGCEGHPVAVPCRGLPRCLHSARVRSLTLASCFVVAMLAACSGEPRRAPDSVTIPPPPPPPPRQFGGGAAPYRMVDVAGGGGRITGEIRFEGDAPRDTM